MTGEWGTDWRGNKYGPGDRILYAGQSGSSSAFIVEAVVIELVPPANDWTGERLRVRPVRSSRPWRAADRPVLLSSPQSVTVLTGE